MKLLSASALPKTTDQLQSLFLLFLAAVLTSAPLSADGVVLSGPDFIAVKNSQRLPARLSARRIPFGIPGDYKPSIAQLKSGELLIVAFNDRSKLLNQPRKSGNKCEEYFVSFRSKDAGLTWGPREELKGPFGREPFLTVLDDGTVLMTSHILPHDVNNQEPAAEAKQYWYSYLHRSTDEGRTWQSLRIGAGPNFDGFPPNGRGTCTDRKAVELPDGTTLLGVSSGMGDGMKTYMWRSKDRGMTWDKSTVSDIQGWRDLDGFFSNSETFRLSDGKLLHVNRVDSSNHPIAGHPPPKGWDAYDRSILWDSTDQGQTWRRVRDMGYYGEHYPQLLSLSDGRILYSWTVRDVGRPLGIQAIVNDDQGKTWDLETDRIIVESRTHMGLGKPFGGGYGNTIELHDRTLVTPYCFLGKDGQSRLELVRWRLPEKR